MSIFGDVYVGSLVWFCFVFYYLVSLFFVLDRKFFEGRIGFILCL